MTEPAPTLRSLLSRRDLGLALADPDLPAGALDAPLRWVHSSDLVDPTPFLADDLLLLTTGTQFAAGDGDEDDDARYVAYVARLQTRGVRGLGFGTEVARDGIPPALAVACREAGMPLFEVPYRTPFIALARANAEAIAAEAYARRTWALSAQRALSLAALRPDGLTATVAELAKQLDTWVGLYDAAGLLTHHTGGLSDEVLAGLAAEVGTVLRRGARAGSTLERDGARFTLQTLGRGGHLRGAIVIAGAGLDLEGRGVVTSVIAMAGLALEQNVGLDRAYAALRAGLVQSLLTDDPALARRVGREIWGALPPAPVVVAVAQIPSGRADAAAGWLELQATETRASLFHGRGPDGLVLVTAEGSPVPAQLAELFEAAVGVADPAPYSAVSRAHAQAVTALRRAAPGSAVAFAEVAATGVLAGLDSPDARARADAHLAPLRAHDAAHGSALVETVRVWLQHDARIDAAASALGVHRHTVRARVAQAQTLLGTDLGAFPARAELWAALVATG
ncbi:PucR family transcriptional regulator [Microbacterium sp. W1N]|uniref:helix-turn-helix domain-containing protein n=1 Tax=Microbacterium festucae TaxID=2977531 RepID=UPI0021C07AF3|nr:PucR family transcriptional regulator [Microbacterium festucae]MCT9820842.1 PucR family transcriptional regulator [Microbacterium festucae]